LLPPMFTVLNGVNTDHFQRAEFNGEAVRRALQIPVQAPIIGTIAVFRFQKRLDLWMELAAKILRQHPETHFIIVGDGPLKQMLYAKRQALGLVDRIHMPGLETEVRPYLAAFDIYMMSSVFEGLPIALLEAMAMECPVIATDAGGIKEVIRDQEDGFLCAVDHPETLVGQADTLLTDPIFRTKYGALARRRVQQGFSMEKMVAELEKLYQQTVSL